MSDRQARIALLKHAVKERILVLDGAMGTQIQDLKLTEEDFRGERLKDWPKDLKGNNDILALTQPEKLAAIHRAYFEAGADFAETNTFSATTIAQADYAAESLAREINYESARIAREVADAVTAETGVQRWVVGVLGPTNRTASISPDVNDPGARNVDFDELREAYRESIDALIEGGVDAIMVETIFDTLNAKAALFAIDEAFEDLGETLPIFISGTITDKSGRTLSGQTAEAFWNSVRHAKPFAIGLNCALGAKDMRPFMAELSRLADANVSAHPNAGLPNAYGEYDETPEQMAGELGAWMKDGLLDIVGGCCGTTPAHIAALRQAVDKGRLRRKPEAKAVMRLSGLEPLTVG